MTNDRVPPAKAQRTISIFVIVNTITKATDTVWLLSAVATRHLLLYDGMNRHSHKTICSTQVSRNSRASEALYHSDQNLWHSGITSVWHCVHEAAAASVRRFPNLAQVQIINCRAPSQCS